MMKIKNNKDKWWKERRRDKKIEWQRQWKIKRKNDKDNEWWKERMTDNEWWRERENDKEKESKRQ